jgi:hypothetical protein
MNELDAFYVEVTKIAYDLFEKRGMVHGHDMADWLEAEMIVKDKYVNKTEQALSGVGSRAGAKANKKSKSKAGK